MTMPDKKENAVTENREMDQKINLLPCPFCGGEARVFADDGYWCLYSVSCAGCDVYTTGYDTRREAIAAWNRRVAPQQPAEPQEPVMDWEQVRLNGGPPCYALNGKTVDGRPKYCGRAQRWDGHRDGVIHAFIAAEQSEPAKDEERKR